MLIVFFLIILAKRLIRIICLNVPKNFEQIFIKNTSLTKTLDTFNLQACVLNVDFIHNSNNQKSTQQQLLQVYFLKIFNENQILKLCHWKIFHIEANIEEARHISLMVIIFLKIKKLLHLKKRRLMFNFKKNQKRIFENIFLEDFNFII